MTECNGRKEQRTANIGLAKNWLTEVIELLFYYFTSVSAEGLKIHLVKEASTFCYKFNFGFGLTDFKYQFFAKPETLYATLQRHYDYPTVYNGSIIRLVEKSNCLRKKLAKHLSLQLML